MHLVYFTAGVIIIFALASNYYINWKEKMMILDRLKRYSELSTINPKYKVAKEFEQWHSNQ
jgi:hypothetical protein